MAKLAVKPATAPAGYSFQALPNQSAAKTATAAGDTIVRSATGAQFAEVAATPPSTASTSSADQQTAVGVIQNILDTFGLGSATADDGTSLAQWSWNQMNASGLDPATADPTAVSQDVLTQLYSTDAFKQRFPGIEQQIAAGQSPTTPAAYVSFEDTIRGIATQYGLNPNIIASPTNIATWIGDGTAGDGSSPDEIATRLSTYLDEYESAPTDVQQAYSQFYGANDVTAFAAHISNMNVTDDQLKQEMESAQIQGAGAALGLNVGQSRSEQLAAMGVSYSSALTALQKVTAESGLYTPTVGEAASSTGQGATTPVTANNQGVTAAFGLDANADQQVQQEKEERANAFKGGGGAMESNTTGGGDFGEGAAQPG